jgi:hypothetical protein
LYTHICILIFCLFVNYNRVAITPTKLYASSPLDLIAIVGGNPGGEAGERDFVSVYKCIWENGHGNSECDAVPSLYFTESEVSGCDTFGYREKIKNTVSLAPDGTLMFSCRIDGDSPDSVYILPRKVGVEWEDRCSSCSQENRNWVDVGNADRLQIDAAQYKIVHGAQMQAIEGLQKVSMSYSPTTNNYVAVIGSPDTESENGGPFFFSATFKGNGNTPNEWCTKSCRKGAFCPGVGAGETLCPVSSYSDSLGMQECTRCEDGKYNTIVGSEVPCTDLCAAGKFSDMTTNDCSDCSAGKFAVAEGSALCAACPDGWSQPVKGQSHCCPSVNGGVCMSCSSKDACDGGVLCSLSFFNTDNDSTNGCEVGCPAVSDGICSLCR